MATSPSSPIGGSNGQVVKRKRPVILPNGDSALNDDGSPKEVEVADAGDSGIYLRGNSKSQVNIWCWPVGSGEVYGYRTDKNQPAEVRAAVTPKTRADNPPGRWNRFIITLKGDRLTVVLNGKTVIENARLPDIPPRGPIALQHHGDSIEFANLYVQEIERAGVGRGNVITVPVANGDAAARSANFVIPAAFLPSEVLVFQGPVIPADVSETVGIMVMKMYFELKDGTKVIANSGTARATIENGLIHYRMEIKAPARVGNYKVELLRYNAGRQHRLWSSELEVSQRP